MASHTRVLNVTNGCRIKRSQALGRIEQCLSRWVKGQEGYQIEDLNLFERVKARAEQSRRQEGLTYWIEGKDGKLIAKPFLAECYGLEFDHDGAQQELQLAAQANRYAQEQAA